MRWWCPHVSMCLFVCVFPLHLFFWLLFSKVFPHWFPLISNDYSIFPFSHMFFLVFVITMFLVFQGGSPMIDGFSILPFSKASCFPLYFCLFFHMGGAGGS